MTYPQTPGWRAGSAETSRLAAEFVAPTAGRMMDRAEDYIRDHGPVSPEEIAAAIAAPGERLLLTSVRARVCQLRNLGRIVDAGADKRGLGESGRVRVIRWRVTTPDERSRWAALKALADEKGPGDDG
ncbi:hypothetical protein [uncultured Phenylobacterium sp.]|uniref:hypothetical protein n=1 Tax=uncultured Phenylobacterium sp. TaxID=349273 RepID=UPI0025F974BB|nr:hypothetical protein [uncultured Phenylobacterium sp.]